MSEPTTEAVKDDAAERLRLVVMQLDTEWVNGNVSTLAYERIRHADYAFNANESTPTDSEAVG